MIQHTIPEGISAMPLERYLKRAWPMLPGHAVRELLKKRDVKRAGERLGAEAVVRGGDALAIYLPDKYHPAPVQLCYEGAGLVAAVKPQGLPVDVDQDGIGADTLLSRLHRTHPTAQLCHRLDAATGGIVLAATDDETCAQALETFRAHALQKKYLALAKGRFDRREGVLKDWLVKDARQSTVRVVPGEIRGAKPIETRYRVIDEKNGIARVELEPVTGRTHQLRAHMAYYGHPLLGDDKYGDRAANKAAPGPLRLWCAELRIHRDSPLTDHRGECYAAPAPQWWEEGK